MDDLEGESRIILKARLSPAVGSTFQPTGFPDLGPAEFERPKGAGEVEQALLVESVQSLANHMESVGWDRSANRPAEPLTGLPYVEVRDAEGRFLTSSRLEPHRLAGAYVRNAIVDGGEEVGDWMIERFGVKKGVPVDWAGVYGAIFQLDPLCLIHGVFFSDPQWKAYGNPKVRRVTTAVIEARGARPVVSGGVKRDDVNPTVEAGKGSKEGYGFVPFGRTEYAAERIELDVAIDLEQIRGYGLDDEATRLLMAIAAWEVRMLIDQPLRLRTSCDLELEGIDVRRPSGWDLPSAEALAEQIEGAKVEFEHEGPYTAVHA